MAARKTPSAGGKPDKLIRDALMVAVMRLTKDDDGKNTTYLNRIASKVVKLAESGDMQASKELFDRIDGKPAQSVALGQDPTLPDLMPANRPPISREEWLKLHGSAAFKPE